MSQVDCGQVSLWLSVSKLVSYNGVVFGLNDGCNSKPDDTDTTTKPYFDTNCEADTDTTTKPYFDTNCEADTDTDNQD